MKKEMIFVDESAPVDLDLLEKVVRPEQPALSSAQIQGMMLPPITWRGRHRGSNKGARHAAPARCFKPLPAKRTRQVLLATEEGLTLEEELAALAAIEQLKHDVPDLLISYATWNAQVRRMLSEKPYPWFLEYVKPSPPDDPFSQEHAEWICFSNQQLSDLAEQAFQEVERERLIQIQEAKRLQYQKMGIELPAVEIPANEFHATWHQSQYHYVALLRALDVKGPIPRQPLAPYARLSRSEQTRITRELTKAGIGAEPFIVCDFSSEPEQEYVYSEALRRGVPGARILHAKEILNIALLSGRSQKAGFEQGLSFLIATLQLEKCLLTVSPSGPFSYLGWGAGTPGVVAVYHGKQPHWDGTFAENTFLLDASNFQPEQLPGAVQQAACNTLQKLTGQ